LGVAASGPYLAWLIEWAVGLRAAVSIASERERGTWDSILTSALESREIIWAKIGGALYALRGLFAAAIIAWSIAAIAGAIKPEELLNWMAGIFFCGTFMAAVGLRASLACTTSTRAMMVTVGGWLLAQALFQMIAWVITAIVTLSMAIANYAATGANRPWTLFNFDLIQQVTWFLSLNGLYSVGILSLVSYTAVRFDRLAGRVAGGTLSIAVEDMLRATSRPAHAAEVCEPESQPVLERV
jgi:ABC-type transport system involved in multi-copper enzyme maturation permease subunit